MSDSLKNAYENGFGPNQRLRPPTSNELAEEREKRVLLRIEEARNRVLKTYREVLKDSGIDWIELEAKVIKRLVDE